MGIIEDYNIDEIAEGAVILDGLNDAIIGVVEEFGNSPRILYSKHKILEILIDERESERFQNPGAGPKH